MEWPCKTIIIGGSHTGKTYLVKTMIMRGDFGGYKRDDLEIYAISPHEASVNQTIWKDLKRRDYNVQTILAKGHVPKINKSNKKTLIVVDDVDRVSRIRFKEITGQDWLEELFGVESHHSDISVVLISHHINIGVPAIRTSADYIVLTNMPDADLKKTLHVLGEDEHFDRIVKQFANEKGLIKDKVSGKLRSFNHVVILRKLLLEKKHGDVVNVPKLYRIPQSSWEKSRLISLY